MHLIREHGSFLNRPQEHQKKMEAYELILEKEDFIIKHIRCHYENLLVFEGLVNLNTKVVSASELQRSVRSLTGI